MKNWFSQVTQIIQREKENTKLFAEIVGYDKIKIAFNKFLLREKPIAVLLTGDPSTCKSLFLLSMKQHCKNAVMYDLTTATGQGLINALFNVKKLDILLIDEIDKLSQNHQGMLYQLLETGLLEETKVKNGKKGRHRQFKNLKVFATCNDIDRLTAALQSRFMRLFLKQYDHAEFIHICRNMAPQFKISQELGEYIGQKLWDHPRDMYIRDYVKCANHSQTQEEVDDYIELLDMYGEQEEEI